MKGRTTFVIAHRLSTIRNATRILLFESGRVIESGTFDELVAKGGRFAELARAQFMIQGSTQDNARQSAETSPEKPGVKV
jgi:ATP-binding cassette subfamily B protein